MALMAIPATAPLQAAPPPTTGADAVAGWTPEGRLRKLHLVRPDLIPYPLAIEVWC